ncbi:YlbF family regulator [Limosilactobacillus gorillae]|uniref:YlbF family regulator n=1 Tax=Limosilactobacillus gorillae TaxID=1450649 RepID=UPI000A48EBF9|nr:YlbF family regulator [Limosilactobacillus gorillae]
MVVNIYDTANELERQMRETQEFMGLKEAFDNLKADKEATDLFVKFQAKQAAAQQKQAQGQQISDDEIKEIQGLAKDVTAKPVIQALMAKEQQVDQMIQQLNQIITGPIQDLYKQLGPQEG